MFPRFQIIFIAPYAQIKILIFKVILTSIVTNAQIKILIYKVINTSIFTQHKQLCLCLHQNREKQNNFCYKVCHKAYKDLHIVKYKKHTYIEKCVSFIYF